MCGVTGFLTSDRTQTADALRRTVAAMADTMLHRGPDDGGAWVDAEAGVALGHRRLSIIDLSPLGHQPMLSADGRYVISFNGEIYNYQPMRAELDGWGYPFKGHSDTEVLLGAVVRWGLEETLRRANGMFAIALWDRQERMLTLARDRGGEKPLYYGRSNGTFLFASELKALHRHPAFQPEIDRESLALYVRYSWMPAPNTIFRDVCQLPAGMLVRLSGREPSLPRPEAYWSARTVAETGARALLALPADEITEQLDNTLRHAVGRRMVADVSVGAFLSGGIDSSTIVALMQAQSPRPIKTFTIGFEEKEYNEAEFAKAIAAHLGTDHTELYVSADDCLDVIPSLPTLYDEPLGDYSQVPTYLVSALARQQVTVALSGDCGDELFAGYNSYPRQLELWSELQSAWALCPQPLRRPLAQGLAAVGTWGLGRFGRSAGAPGPIRKKLLKRFRRLQKRSSSLIGDSPADLYGRYRDRCVRADDFVVGARGRDCLLTRPDAWANGVDPLLAMQHLDFITYMVDDVLVKVDRASMASSLEVRCPMLDPDVIALAWSLPATERLGPDGGKSALRRVLARYVPRPMFERPKQGFGLPVERWLRGPLRDWAEDLLDEARLASEGYLRPESVRRTWAEHLSGQQEHTFILWSLLMFQAWREAWSRPGGPPLATPSSATVSGGPAPVH